LEGGLSTVDKKNIVRTFFQEEKMVVSRRNFKEISSEYSSPELSNAKIIILKHNHVSDVYAINYTEMHRV
jgi:hypothetical protein